MTDISKPVYYEAHITVDSLRLNINQFPVFKNVCGSTWKVSRFEEDEVDGHDGKWFATTQSDNLESIFILTSNTVSLLDSRGYRVMRAKIEQTLFDTKYNDKMDGIS